MATVRFKVSTVLDAVKMKIPEYDLLPLRKVLEALGEEKINLWLGVKIKNKDDFMNITLCFDPQTTDYVSNIIKKNFASVDFSIVKSVVIISVFPFRDNAEIAFRLIKTLEESSVPLLVLSTSLSSISCLIPYKHCGIATESLKTAFGLKSKKL